MSTEDQEPQRDPILELLQPILEARQKRIDEHAALRESQPYQAAVKQLDRLAADYGIALNAIDLMATRYPPFFETLITLRVKPHFVQSLIAAVWMAKEGMLDPARRELRFLLEASVKTLWLDMGGRRTDGSHTDPGADVASKVDALDDLGAQRFGDIVDGLEFGLLSDEAKATYRQTATDLYSRLSTHNHISTTNVARDLSKFDSGRAFGFETVEEVDAVARLAKRVLDLALSSHFEAFDHGLVGDILVHVFDDEPRWAFRKTPLVGAINQHFDYKAERDARHEKS